MASIVQKLFRSFINTLFYVRTVIQALFSLRSPNPFPFRETSTVVPYPLDIDLEIGSGGMNRRGGDMPCPAPSPVALPPSQNPVQKTILADAHLQESLRCSPAFSSTPPLRNARNVQQGSPDAVLSASAKAMVLASWATKSTTMGDHERSLPPIAPFANNEMTEDTIAAPCDITLDPFLVTNPASAFFFVNEDNDRQLEDVLPISFKLPFYTSTPKRPRRDGKGHRRAALATITNIAHLNIPVSFSESLPSPTATEPLVDTPLKKGKDRKRAALATITDTVHFNIFANVTDSLASPTATELLVDTPSVQRLHSASLRLGPAYEDIRSASPTPTKGPSPSLSTSSHGTQFSPVSPLRIVKRKRAKPAGVQTPPTSEASVGMITPDQRNNLDPSSVRSSAMSDVSRVVTSAVRDAFVETREEDQDDEGMAARELISRASVWTCDFPRNDADMDAVEQDEESEGEYSEEAIVRASCSESPPPPYAFSNPGINPKVASEAEGTMLQAACVASACASTEPLCLGRNMPLSSADSCLDDILASFEQLITTMPKFHTSLAKSQGALLSAPGGTEKFKKGVSATAALETVRRALNDNHGERAAQWSDVLRLDKYQ